MKCEVERSMWVMRKAFYFLL